ncbi:hypothetical protein PVA17_03550 [Lysinibacillus sp. CNPSo 3705]|uniref:hypothetical protein n=1 Tax=Lysinibacillus sp. CNPSo 3705 TaxID=3028148 RepID=UPI002363F727|nr:hypothetical protein [Lysinibacillus sp. CNPSo 3705]MDD1501844.1 hypothetical protein [Lysinibacillus sp. CNPSo 3705]
MEKSTALLWIYIRLEGRLGDALGMSDRGIKAKTITPYDKAFVTNIVLLLSLRCTTLSRQKHLFRPKFWSVVDVVCAKAKRQQHVFACAKAKRQQHDFFCAKSTTCTLVLLL